MLEKNIYFHQTRQGLEVFITEAKFKGWITKETGEALKAFLENAQFEINLLAGLCNEITTEIHNWEEANNFGWIRRNIIARSPLFWFRWLIQRNRFRKIVYKSKKLFKKASLLHMPTDLRASVDFAIPTLSILKPSLESLARISELNNLLYRAESIIGYLLYQIDTLVEVTYYIQSKQEKGAENLIKYILSKSLEIQRVIYTHEEESDWPTPLIPLPDFVQLKNNKTDLNYNFNINNINNDNINNNNDNNNNNNGSGSNIININNNGNENGNSNREIKEKEEFEFIEEFEKLEDKQEDYHKKMKKDLANSTFHHSKWIPYGIFSALLITGGSLLYYFGRHEIRLYLIDTYKQLSNASYRLYKEHFEEPISKIYRTIRYDENSLKITDPKAIQLEVETLGTMVRDYVADNYKSIPNDPLQRTQFLERVAGEAKAGDLSRILDDYSQTIKHPIKSALQGELIRLVLIQVQKMKVDAENMVGVMDQLLRANELNFQALALMPAVLFFSFISYQLFSILTRKPSRQKGLINLRTEMRRIDVTLNQYLREDCHVDGCSSLLKINSNYATKTTSCSDKGKIFVAVLKVQSLFDILPVNQQSHFFEDTNQLLDRRLTPMQKMSVVSRIFNVFINSTK